MNTKKLYIYLPIILFTLIFTFFFDFDISNGGASRDLYYHWEYIIALNQDIGILLERDHSYKNGFSQHYPLHHIIVSRFDFLSTNVKTYLNFYFFFSLFLPILFYYCIKNRFPEIDNNKKIFISSIIYFLPNYQSSAIWGNTHISSLFFFLGSIYFLNNLEKKEEIKIYFNIFFVVFFMACAAYIRQYYIIFFPYLFIFIYMNAKFKNTVFFCLVSFFLSLPGLYFYTNNPMLLGGLLAEYTDFKSSILIVFSIVLVYLFPLYISNLNYNVKRTLELFENKKFSILFSLSIIIIFYIFLNFNYIGYLGGGFFYKISKVLIGNNLLFFAITLVSLFLCFYYFGNRLSDIILIIILSISFSTGYVIFQKYFEPMFLFIIFLLIDRKLVKKIFSFNIHVVFIYFSIYWIVYFIYASNLIKKMHLLLPQVGYIVIN